MRAEARVQPPIRISQTSPEMRATNLLTFTKTYIRCLWDGHSHGWWTARCSRNGVRV